MSTKSICSLRNRILPAKFGPTLISKVMRTDFLIQLRWRSRYVATATRMLVLSGYLFSYIKDPKSILVLVRSKPTVLEALRDAKNMTATQNGLRN